MPVTADHAPHRLEHWVHWTLLSGLIVSSALLIAGLLVTLAQRAEPPPERPASPAAVVQAPARSNAAALLLELGLLVLMATPVLRVIALLVGWTTIRETRFALVALTVLGLLVLSVGLGFH